MKHQHSEWRVEVRHKELQDAQQTSQLNVDQAKQNTNSSEWIPLSLNNDSS